MTNLTQLWQRRFRYFVNELGKYGRLIFNDHFSIVLVILMGFGSFFYREQLVQLQSMNLNPLRLPISVAITFLFVVVFTIGRPIWLTRDPDKSYLFPQGKAWQAYWMRGIAIGMVLPALLLIATLFLVAPFVVLVSAWQLSEWWLLALLIIGLKLASYVFQYLNIFSIGFRTKNWQHYLVAALILFSSFQMPAPFHLYGLIGMVLLVLGVAMWQLSQCERQPMDFHTVLEQEALRESTFYKWVSIFADVPHLQPSIKRRAFLDKGIDLLSRWMPNRYSYLYLRVLFRNNAYSGIWLRVMVFIAVMLLLTNQVYLAVGLGIIGYVLTIIQLVPVIHLYDQQPFQRLYPERSLKQATAFQQPILWIFGLQTFVYLVILSIGMGHLATVLLIASVWIVTALLIVYLYIPWWAKKHVN